MADTTRLTIDIETILRGLEQTLRGLERVRQSLQSVANVKTGTQQTANVNKAAAATQRLQQQQDRAAISAQRLAQQQQQLGIRAQQLANAQTRADQVTQRLAQSQQRLDAASARAASNLGQQADAHVRAFRAAEAATTALNQKLSNVGNALRSVGQGLASIGATLSVVLTAPLVAAGAASVDAAVRLDSLKRGLTAIVGSADEANRQLARLTQIAKLPGIGFEEAIQGSIRLQAVGFSAAEAEKSLKAFANAVALTGGGRDELNRVTVQLGQLAAKGKVLSQDLRPIIEAAPAVGRALLQAFGTVNADDIQALGLSSKEFLGTLTDELDKLPRAAAGAKNSFENFRDEIFRAAAAVGAALLPGLIRLAEVAGPIITKLADTFANLPQPLQIAVVGLAGLLAALGPIAFVAGQLILGVGRLLVGFVELNAAGILPTIANLRTLAAGSLTAAAAERTLAASTALVAGVLGGIAAIIATVVTAYAVYNAFQKDAVTLSKEHADALTAEIDRLEQQAKFLAGLKAGVERTADEQQRLLEIYDKLNITTQARITGISDEEKRLLALRAELEKLIQLREQERVQAAATVAGNLATTLESIAANEKEIDSITARIQANNQLADSIRQAGQISAENSRLLAERGINFSDVESVLGALQAESEELVRAQHALRDATSELNDKAKDEVEVLRTMERQTGLTARQLLVVSRNMGGFRGEVDSAIKLLERYVQQTDDATKSTDAFSRALAQQKSDALKAGEAADALAKGRKAIIEANAATAREASDSFEGALKFFRAFIAAQPELRAALQREAQIQGKSFDQIVQKSLESAFGRGKLDKAGTSLRNAQEQLAKAQAEVALASSERQVAIEKQKNDELLQQAESAQRLQLISYREFLETRAALTAASLDKEITQQQAVVTAAKDAQRRLLAEAGKPGIPVPERTKRLAEATSANEAAIKAETKLTELTDKRQVITNELNRSLKEAQHEQLKDIRQLEIEYGQLTGRIEDALNAATDEKFRETLTDLALAQDHLNKQIEEATKAKDADKLAELQLARAENQRQIDAIANIQQQDDALASLAAANELVRRAKERQSDLETQLAFETEFRGLKEEDAIKRRLAGEEKLNDSLTVAHETIRQIVADLEARGVQPPQALIKFLNDLSGEVKGLAELPFSEQFRLAQKEFDRLNDERLRKIADVERAVRNRDIAEVEGAIVIRRINGLYTADLEAQLVLLQQIAEASNDRGLQKQAADAAETVKDTRDQIASLGKQIESAGKDALRSGFRDFFNDLANRTATAKDALLNLLNSVTRAINDVIAENLSKKLFESLFGGPDAQAGTGLVASIKRLLGLGGDQQPAAAAIQEAVPHAEDAAHAAALEAAASASAAALTSGATVASVALTTGGTTVAATIVSAATAFASAVVAAGAAFAAAIGVSGGTQAAAGGLGSLLGGAAATGLYPAVPGGVYRIVEGGYPEAVLTTDPRHATRQASILREFLQKTRGLYGRVKAVPEFAAGGIISARDAEINLLSGMTMRSPVVSDTALDSAPVSAAPTVSIRNINQINRGELVRGHLRSAEGTTDILNIISENAPDIKRRIGVA